MKFYGINKNKNPLKQPAKNMVLQQQRAVKPGAHDWLKSDPSV